MTKKNIHYSARSCLLFNALLVTILLFVQSWNWVNTAALFMGFVWIFIAITQEKKNPEDFTQERRFFPQASILLVLSFGLSWLPLENSVELFRNGMGISLVVSILMLTLASFGVYYSFTRKENWYSRLGMAGVILAIWYPFYVNAPRGTQGMVMFLALVAAIPLLNTVFPTIMQRNNLDEEEKTSTFTTEIETTKKRLKKSGSTDTSRLNTSLSETELNLLDQFKNLSAEEKQNLIAAYPALKEMFQEQEKATKTITESKAKKQFNPNRPRFVQHTVGNRLAGFLENTQDDEVVAILRAIIAHYGKNQDRTLLKEYFPKREFLTWLNFWPIEADYELLWAVGNVLTILPNPKAEKILRKHCRFLQDKIRNVGKESITIIADKSPEYQPALALGAILTAIGACLAMDKKYTNFSEDERLLERIAPLEERLEPLRKEVLDLNKKLKTLVERLYYQEGLSNYDIQYHPEFVEIDGPFQKLQAEISVLIKKRDALIEKLSGANYLLRIAKNGMDYTNYIRQYACMGLSFLLNSFLDKATKTEVQNTINSVKAESEEDVEVEKMVMNEDGDNLAGVGLLDFLKKMMPSVMGESVNGMSIYEVRLLPFSRVGEVVFVLKNTLKQFEKSKTNLSHAALFAVVEEICHLLPDAIDFFTAYPLKLMPKMVKKRLGFYREQGYHLQFWTRYIPPKDKPGNVIERYLEVLDYTQPNSLGLVVQLFQHRLLVIPILYHEYLHYTGIKNEAKVWLMEHLFLRYLIARHAPEDNLERQAYWAETVLLFAAIGDDLTLAFLNTDFTEPASIDALNSLITRLYGEQKTKIEAATYAQNTIDKEDKAILMNNALLRWDRHKPFPMLSEDKSQLEKENLKIILETKARQKNTMSHMEAKEIFEQKEVKAHLEAWTTFSKEVWDFDEMNEKLPTLFELIETWNGQDENLVVFKG